MSMIGMASDMLVLVRLGPGVVFLREELLVSYQPMYKENAKK